MARNQKNKKSTRRTLSVEHLQSRQLMAADLAMAMAPEFDLDLSSMEVGQARVGQEIAFDMISSGATAGTAGGLVRFQLDPDSDQTPAGATLTEDGFFQWNPSEDQVGEFTFTVIAVNRDNFCEADAEKFTIVVRPMNEAPDLAGVPDQVSPRGVDFAMDVSATDPNAGDSLTLNVINGPQGVSVEQTDSGQWVVHWTPDPGTPPGTYQFELQVSDGELTDTELFNVELTNAIPMIDLNGPEDEGTGSRQTFVEGKGSVPIAVDVAINDSDDAVLQSATARIVNPMNGAAESLGVDVSDTNITASYDSETGTLTLTGEDTVENYQRVLGSLSYNNESQDPHACPRQVEVTVNDGWDTSVVATATIEIVAVNQGPNLILPGPYDDEATPVEVHSGEEITFPTTVVDPDSTQFKYIVDLDGSNLPAEASQPMISPEGEFSWTPDTPGTFVITLIVLDDHGAADQETFTVTVTEQVCHSDDGSSHGDSTGDEGTGDEGTGDEGTDDGEMTPTEPEDVLYAHDRDSQLFTINVATGDVHVIAQMSEQMFDIAFDNNGKLYGISHDGGLYSINAETAEVTLIGSTGHFINALEFSPTGELYGAGNSLYLIDPATGGASEIGDLSGFTSDGDLAFGPDGRLLLAAENDQLVEVDPKMGTASLVGAIAQPGKKSLDILGLDYHANGSLYGFSNDQESVVLIDPATGAATEVASFAEHGLTGVYGASFYRIEHGEPYDIMTLPGRPEDDYFAMYDFLELESSVMDALVDGNLLSGSSSEVI